MELLPVLFSLLKKYWWVLVIAALCFYAYSLRLSIVSKESSITKLEATIIKKDAEYNSLKLSLSEQNKAIDVLAAKGKEQAKLLSDAIQKVSKMEPVTQVKIHEIYKDTSKGADELLLNALND